MSLIKNKKGSSLDLFFVVVAVFTVTIIGIMVSAVVTRFNNEVQKIDAFPSEAKDASNTLSNTMPSTLNGGILFLFFGACILALILASLTPFHPVFAIFFIFEWLVLMIFTGVIADAFQKFIEADVMATEYGQYGTIIFLFRWLPLIIGIIGFILAAVMYKVKSNYEMG